MVEVIKHTNEHLLHSLDEMSEMEKRMSERNRIVADQAILTAEASRFIDNKCVALGFSVQVGFAPDEDA